MLKVACVLSPGKFVTFIFEGMCNHQKHFSALEGTCHGPGTPSDYDKGAPTYFRYPIETSGGGQHSHPGTAYAVLYSLQRNAGKFCDFKSYTDTEVLVAMTDVMEWIEVVSMEINGTKQSIFDIEYSKVALDLQAMRVTTTQQTTELLKVFDI